MKLVLGADPFGYYLKEEVKKHLVDRGIKIEDLTPSKEKQVPYYEVATLAATKIQRGEADKGILFCGTGMGVAIVANKFKGVYAGVVESEFAGQHCKCINNTNILTMGGMITAPYRAKKIVDQWLNTSFTEGYSEFADFLKESLTQIQKIETETMK